MSDPYLNLELSESFPVSAEKLFHVWTDQTLVRKWLYARTTSVPGVVEIDARVGGRYRMSVEDHEGNFHPVSGMFKQVNKPDSFDCTWIWEQDSLGVGETSWQMHFIRQGGACQLNLKHLYFTNQQAYLFHQDYWHKALRLLQEYLRTGE